MDGSPSPIYERKVPSRRESAMFRLKTLLLQAKRVVTDQTSGKTIRFTKRNSLQESAVLARSVTPLWTETDSRERFLVAGKIQNLRIAVSSLNGVEIPANETFSFWKHVGRASRFRGYVAGRELREGCIIPNVGGGLCQLSNALFDAAMQAGFEIVERHAHTQIVAGSLAESGRDATVFWNYVDLRFLSPKPFRIEARLDANDLTVTFRGQKSDTRTLHQINKRGSSPEPNSCATCETGDCHRVVKPGHEAGFGRSAFLVDEYSREFDAYLQRSLGDQDLLCVPLDGNRFKKANYAWNTAGFHQVRQSPIVAAVRSYRSRKLAAQGSARQLNLLKMYEELAESYARKLSFDVLHVTVQQNLLPFLWKNGHLGGRTFDVLMTALPMHELQRRLDHANSLHPGSKTLGDFRADEGLVLAEKEALENARRIVTPHSEIASLFHERTELLEWSMPSRTDRTAPKNEKPIIVFPASTVGRKGCYELREALIGLDIKLLTLGPHIEGADFWNGFDVERGGEDWLQIVDIVVLPAFIEHKPRRLLLAAASGIPVIASKACGVNDTPGIRTVDAGDVGELAAAIREMLSMTAK